MRGSISVMAAVMLLLAGSASFAQQNVVGFNRINVPANSDVLLTVPFTGAPYNGAGNEDSAAVFTVTGTTGGSTINVAGGLTSGKFNAADVTKNSYYVRMLTGNAAGLWMTIKSNDASSFLLDDTLTAQRAALVGRVAGGDTFRVYKHLTIAGVFPPELFGVSYVNGTTLLLFQNNVAAMGQNPPAWRQVAYTTTGGGRWLGSGVDGTTSLRPETQFILRNGAAQSLAVVLNGTAPDYAVSYLLAPGGDLVVGTGYPVPLVLQNSGLGGTNQRAILFYDNTTTGQNKPAVKQASYTTSGGGRWVGSGVTGQELLNPSQGFKFRLPAGEAGTMVTLGKPY
jgi:uncharacterized protein (TIGR02597 family)